VSTTYGKDFGTVSIRHEYIRDENENLRVVQFENIRSTNSAFSGDYIKSFSAKHAEKQSPYVFIVINDQNVDS
jgi:hypothetical protein